MFLLYWRVSGTQNYRFFRTNTVTPGRRWKWSGCRRSRSALATGPAVPRPTSPTMRVGIILFYHLHHYHTRIKKSIERKRHKQTDPAFAFRSRDLKQVVDSSCWRHTNTVLSLFWGVKHWAARRRAGFLSEPSVKPVKKKTKIWIECVDILMPNALIVWSIITFDATAVLSASALRNANFEFRILPS